MPRKRCVGKNEREPLLSIGDMGHGAVDPGVGASNKRFLRQSNPRIIKDPLTVGLVWRNDVDRIHLKSCVLMEPRCRRRTVALQTSALIRCAGSLFERSFFHTARAPQGAIGSVPGPFGTYYMADAENVILVPVAEVPTLIAQGFVVTDEQGSEPLAATGIS